MALRTPVWREHGARGVVLTLFVGGLTLGGMLTATVLWLLAGAAGWLPPVGRTTALLLAAVTVAAHELRLIRLRLPQNHRQVPQEIFARGPYLSALQFGFELGTGVRTYLPSALPYMVVAAVILLQPSFPIALGVGASFGLGRAAMAVARTLRPDPDRWDALLRDRLRLVQAISATSGVVLCVALAESIGGWPG